MFPPKMVTNGCTSEAGYSHRIDTIREEEYPMLKCQHYSKIVVLLVTNLTRILQTLHTLTMQGLLSTPSRLLTASRKT